MKTKDIMLRAAAASLLVGGMTLGGQAQACSASSPYLGEVCAMAIQYCPEGTVTASGQLLPINQNQPLYALIGTAYGGDGVNTFAVPNLNLRTPVGAGSGVGVPAFGQALGTSSVAVTTANLPPHTHAATMTPTLSLTSGLSAKSVNGADTVPQAGDMLGIGNAPAGLGTAQFPAYIPAANAGTTVNLGGAGSSFTGSGLVTVSPAGSGGSLAVTSPQIAMTYCIVTNGLYPQKAN